MSQLLPGSGSLPDTRLLLLEGMRAREAAESAVEATKCGTLRAGNTGAFLVDGTHVGKCARLSYLRMVGVDAGDDDASRGLMFAAGHSNEDDWLRMLLDAGQPGLVVKCEEEIPIEWRTSTGRKVTGRPDMVLGWEVQSESAGPGVKFVPQRVIELKLVSSVWTARDVLLRGEPKLMHLLQVAHYSWKLGVPGELWYTSRADFHVPFGKEWPRKGEPKAEYFAYGDDGKPLKFTTFLVGYVTRWVSAAEDEVLEYQQVFMDGKSGPWIRSVVTKKGIEAYYEIVDLFAAGGDRATLPTRPTNLMADGKPAKYDACKYCVLKPVCDRSEGKARVVWEAEVRSWLANQPVAGSIRLDKLEQKK